MTRHKRTWLFCFVALAVSCTSISLDTGGDDEAGESLIVSGQIQAESGAARAAGNTVPAHEDFLVVAQSATTGELYQGQSDPDGKFEVEIPDSEAGAAFMVSIIKPDGRAAGPVVFGQDDDGDGMTGVKLDRDASFGTLVVPGDVMDGPIEPGDDNDVGDMVDPHVLSRLDEHGVPVGLMSAGKGDDADGDAVEEGDQRHLDMDRDGLPDMIDADDDGDGVVDEFDGEGEAGGIPAAAGIRLNFFTNLKIGNDRADIYYDGAEEDIETARETDTIITFEIMAQHGAAHQPVAARVLERPGPAYLPISEKMDDSTGSLTFDLWSDTSYEFDDAGDRLQAFVRPNALLEAGDLFTVLVEFDDGNMRLFSRMINYVFTNIPQLQQHGTPTTLTAFDGTQPIEFDGTQNLVLVFNPPTDDTGAYLTGMDYHFEIFYNDSGGSQLNHNIDAATTFPSPPAGFDTTAFFYVVQAADLTLSADNTFTVELPKEIFVDSVQTASGAQAVASYKIDIAAQNRSNNAAVMLQFEKQ